MQRDVTNVDQVRAERQLWTVLFQDAEREQASALRLMDGFHEVGGRQLFPFDGERLGEGDGRGREETYAYSCAVHACDYMDFGGTMAPGGTIASVFPGVNILAQTPRALRELLTAATEDDLEWQPRPDRWSITMVLAHLADLEEKGFVSRFHAIATEDNPHLPAYDQLALFRGGGKFDGRAELENSRGCARRRSRY